MWRSACSARKWLSDRLDFLVMLVSNMPYSRKQSQNCQGALMSIVARRHTNMCVKKQVPNTVTVLLRSCFTIGHPINYVRGYTCSVSILAGMEKA